MKLAICEDEKIYSQELSKHLTAYFQLHNEPIDIDYFTDGAPLIESINNTQYDIIFLDIQLETSDGVEVAKKIRNSSNEVKIIFVTGLENRAVDGYEVNAFDYIVKTSMSQRISKVMDRYMKTVKKTTIAIPTLGQETEMVNLNQIIYAESNRRGTAIHTENDVIYSTLSITKIAGMLPADSFIEVYKSIYVKTVAIKHIGVDSIDIVSGIQLPLSRRKRKEVQKAVIQIIKEQL